jgi:flavin-dependent dehydrogenase
MNNVIADALVVGGGIAGGALAAYLARAGRHVIVIERQPGPRDKVCGEFISAEAAYYLRELAIDLNALGAFAISSVRAYTEKHAASAPLPFEAFSISRRALDEAVLRRASSWGAEVWRGCVVRSLQRRDGHWIAKLDGNATVIAHAAFLATGKHDLKGFKRPPGRQNDLVGFKLHWRLAATQQATLGPAVELFLFPGGYAGLELVEGGIANFCLVVRREHFTSLGGRWDFLLSALRSDLPPLHERLAGGEPCWQRPLAISSIPYGYLRRSGDGPWRLGDQAAVIPSFAGEGISIALHSARLAAQSYIGACSQAEFESQLASDIGPQVRSATLLSRMLVHRSGQTAVMALTRRIPLVMGNIAQHTRIAKRRLIGGTFRNEFSDAAREIRSLN